MATRVKTPKNGCLNNKSTLHDNRNINNHRNRKHHVQQPAPCNTLSNHRYAMISSAPPPSIIPIFPNKRNNDTPSIVVIIDKTQNHPDILKRLESFASNSGGVVYIHIFKDDISCQQVITSANSKSIFIFVGKHAAFYKICKGFEACDKRLYYLEHFDELLQDIL